MNTTDYHVVTDDGRMVFTSSLLEIAAREADRRSDLGEDVAVHKVVTTTKSTEVYKPRAPREQAVAA